MKIPAGAGRNYHLVSIDVNIVYRAIYLFF